MTVAKDGYEYFRHRDGGGLYRCEPGEMGWEHDVHGVWKPMQVPLSDQDHDHLYPVEPDEVEAARQG